MSKFILRIFSIFLHRIEYYITLLLFFIPFFWLKNGEMDLGGDSSRLFFYDPTNYFLHSTRYAVQPIGMGFENPLYMMQPFIIFLMAIKCIIQSPTVLISIFNGLQLSCGFFAMHLFIKEILTRIPIIPKEHSIFPSILAGLLYIFSPLMTSSGWEKSFLTHAQIFLNPLMGYMILKVFLTHNPLFGYVGILISFLFSTNFSWGASPNILSFYPFLYIFLFIYVRYCLKKTVIVSHHIRLLLLFLLVHSFHYIPLIMSIMSKSGLAYDKIVATSPEGNPAIHYFMSIASQVNLWKNILLLPNTPQQSFAFPYTFVFVPLVFISFIFYMRRFIKYSNYQLVYIYVLIFLFYSLSLFFTTAHITSLGMKIYAALFNIPGFSMFRNFLGQWMFTYMFFSSVLFGLSAVIIFSNQYYKRIITTAFLLFMLILLSSSYNFITGSNYRMIHNPDGQKQFSTVFVMDHTYEQLLKYVRDTKGNAKMLTLPLTESFVTMFRGLHDDGVYQGPSPMGHLTGHNDFNGYQVLPPFSEVLIRLVKDKDYGRFARLLGILNIRNIVFNSDNDLLIQFPHYPYEHIRNFMPMTASDYDEFVNHLPVTLKEEFGSMYYFYELSSSNFLPKLFISNIVKQNQEKLDPWGNYERPFFFDTETEDSKTVYVEKDIQLDINANQAAGIVFKKINTTKYYISVFGADKDTLLVFNEFYNKNWKIYKSKPRDFIGDSEEFLSGSAKEYFSESRWIDNNTFETMFLKPISETDHIKANGYANAWKITLRDGKTDGPQSFILEYFPQRYAYISWIVSGIGLSILCIAIIRSVRTYPVFFLSVVRFVSGILYQTIGPVRSFHLAMSPLGKFIFRLVSRNSRDVLTVVSRYGFSLEMNMHEYFYSGFSFLGETNPHETRLVRSLLHKGDTMIDVGAHIGWYSLIARDIVGSTGKVVAFEPNPACIDVLERNISMNAYVNVILEKVALSDRNGYRTFFIGDDMGGSFSKTNTELLTGKNRTVESIRVQTITLDSYVQKHTLTHISLIKIDVEGAELHVIQGAENVLKRFKPYLLIEMLDKQLENARTSRKIVLEYLSKLGYISCRYLNGKCIERKNPIEIRDINILFAHKDSILE